MQEIRVKSHDITIYGVQDTSTRYKITSYCFCALCKHSLTNQSSAFDTSQDPVKNDSQRQSWDSPEPMTFFHNPFLLVTRVF
jgi:hypothetical protein